MAKPIWTGAISFGLLHIPVQLMPAERRTELKFHMLDARDKHRVRYERLNAETGKPVPWKEVVKAYEYEKGSYVVLEEEDLRNAAPQSKESVDIESFVDLDQISPKHFEKPYYLVPARKAEKGYVLLRETLRELGKAGLARVVIRTRESLALVFAEGEALVMLLMRFPAELIPAEEYQFPEKSARGFKLSARELDMARQLVGSMSADWQPEEYKDEFRERLNEVIRQRIGKKKVVRSAAPESAEEPGAATNVVDFMSLLKKSLDQGRRTPAKKRAAARRPAAAPRRSPRRRTAK